MTITTNISISIAPACELAQDRMISLFFLVCPEDVFRKTKKLLLSSLGWSTQNLYDGPAPINHNGRIGKNATVHRAVARSMERSSAIALPVSESDVFLRGLFLDLERVLEPGSEEWHRSDHPVSEYYPTSIQNYAFDDRILPGCRKIHICGF